jgi:hypothetical protein
VDTGRGRNEGEKNQGMRKGAQKTGKNGKIKENQGNINVGIGREREEYKK